MKTLKILSIKYNFKSLRFCFYTFGARRPLVNLRALDLVQILPDPDLGKISVALTSIERISMKTKRGILKLSKILVQ